MSQLLAEGAYPHLGVKNALSWLAAYMNQQYPDVWRLVSTIGGVCHRLWWVHAVVSQVQEQCPLCRMSIWDAQQPSARPSARQVCYMWQVCKSSFTHS